MKKQFTKEEVQEIDKETLKSKKEIIDVQCELELKRLVKKMRTVLKKEGLAEVMDANISFTWILK